MSLFFQILANANTVLLDYLPAFVVVVLWALVLSCLSMLIYRLLSPQKIIKALKLAQRELKCKFRSQSHEEIDVKDAFRLIGLSSKQVLLTFLPTLLAILPVLHVLGFLDTQLGYQLPKVGDHVNLVVNPSIPLMIGGKPIIMHDKKESIVWPMKNTHLSSKQGETIALINVEQPTNFYGHRDWSSYIIPNPGGYLQSSSQTQSIVFSFKERSYIPFGPFWLRNWLVVFFLSLFIFSLSIKMIFRIA